MAQAQVTADDLNLLTWRWVGPVNFSGRITEFAVPPGQTTTYYVLAASGGVWKTEDAGTHFEPIFDKYGNMSMGSLGIAASDPKVLYLGTGEPMHARSSSHGNGVWKSTDAGKTWTNVGLAKSYFIPKVQVDPKNPDVVYVAAEGKLYDNEMDCERGFYVTTDGGKTWERRWPLADRGVGDFVVDPRDFNVVIAQAYKLYRRTWTYIDRQPGNHLYKTTDGGKTWKKLTQGLPTDDRRRPGRPGHLPQEPRHRLRPDRRGGQPRPGRARRRRQLPGPDGLGRHGLRGRRDLRRRQVLRHVEGLQDRSPAGQAGPQVHARRRPPTRPSWSRSSTSSSPTRTS